MAIDWHSLSDDRLYAIGEEQPNSQNHYNRQLEIDRRRYLREQELGDLQAKAAQAQIDAAKAARRGAFWSMVSAIAVTLTFIAAVAGLLVK